MPSVINLERESLVPAGLGGLRGDILILLPEEIATFPEIVNDIDLANEIQFTEGGGPRTWHCTKGTGLVKSDSVGRKGGALFQNSINFDVPSNAPDLLRQVTALLGKRVIAIGLDASNQRRVVGTPLRLATVTKSSHTTGTSRTNRPGASFEIVAFSPLPALFYLSDLSPFSDTDYAYTPL